MYQHRKSPIPMLLGIIFGIVLCVCTLGAMAGSTAGATTKTAPRDAASGLATGKRQHKPVSITKPVGKSPGLAGKLPALKGGGVPGKPGAPVGPGVVRSPRAGAKGKMEELNDLSQIEQMDINAASAAPLPKMPALPALPEPPAYGLDREAGKVGFGNGVTGARPPSGAGNVGATYRHGGGSARHEIAHTVQQRSGVMLTPLHDPRTVESPPSDTGETQKLDMQNALQAKQQSMQTMSNVLKATNDSQKAIINNQK